MNEPMEPLMVITMDDLRVVLEPDLGPLTDLELMPPGEPPSSIARWSAVNMDGDLVDGAVDVRLVQQEDGAFLLKPIVTLAGPSGRLMELPWAAGSTPLGTAP
jgi:hypothetical protein